MASALDLNMLNPTPEFDAARGNMEAGQAQASANLQTGHLKKMYEQRTVPDLYAQEGAQGNLYSGGAQEANTRAGEDYAYASGNVTDQLRQHIASLITQRAYSFLGVQ